MDEYLRLPADLFALLKDCRAFTNDLSHCGYSPVDDEAEQLYCRLAEMLEVARPIETTSDQKAPSPCRPAGEGRNLQTI
jgi:hypothetical protein